MGIAGQSTELPLMPITIRPLTPADLPAADRILQAAFDRPYSFTPMLQLNGAAQPGNQSVAEIDGQVVATVGAVNYGEFAYVALMGVDPAYHRRGIARQMMDHVLERLDAQQCPMVLLDATDAGAALYEQIGFVDDSHAYEYQGMPTASSHQHSRQVRPMQQQDLPEVIEFDAPRFGANRANVLQALFREAPQRALVSRDQQGPIRGFAFARAVLGAWVAGDIQTAAELLDAACALQPNEPVHVQVPRSNEQAAALLQRRGLKRLRTLRHMRRGGSGPPGKPEHLFGQVSFGLG